MTERARALTVLIAVFLLGSVIGAAAYHLYTLRASASDRPFGPPGKGGRPRMLDVLHLSPEQQKSFDTIMEESRSRMEALQAESAPKFKAIRVETDARILAILDEPQKKKFEELVREMDRRMGRWRPPGDGPVPGPRPQP